MNHVTQHGNGVIGVRGQAAGAALALAILFGLAVLATGTAQAQTYSYSVLYAFMYIPDGGLPMGVLVRDAQGNLYGTTWGGGAYSDGTVFKLDTSGNETVLYSFTGPPYGAYPQAGLVRDAQGNLYGTTYWGGVSNSGTVFKLDTSGNETVLHSFGENSGDGTYPSAGLVRDAQGNLYGTTAFGGAYGGSGTVFKVDPTGNETVLYSFTGTGGDGRVPYAGLVRDAQGNLYGATWGGGAYSDGTVFKLDTSGNETVLYSFTGPPDGAYPQAGLVRDAQGNLYGTTYRGGVSNSGTVFKLDTSGNETVLHSFTGPPDGAYPQADLVRDAQGNLYGTTYHGGVSDSGTVFKLDKKDEETVLYSFEFSNHGGGYPFAGLVRDAQGNLYGTAESWGPYYYGTVFKLTPLPATTTTLTSSPNPSSYGQAVTFTAAVTSSLGAPLDGETVSFMNGATSLGTGTLSGGSASFATSALPVGTTAVTAVYGGDADFGGSTSKKVNQKVGKDTTTTALLSSPSSPSYGQAVTFTATVTPAPPDGEIVTFKGIPSPNTAMLSGGSASITTSALKVGTTAVTAMYGGDANLAASKSSALSQTVGQATTTTTLASSLNPSAVGQSVTFTATVTPEYGGTATGNVKFYDGTTLLKSVVVSGGAAAYTTSKLKSGTHGITATYNGSTSFIGSTSSTLTQTVE